MGSQMLGEMCRWFLFRIQSYKHSSLQTLTSVFTAVCQGKIWLWNLVFCLSFQNYCLSLKKYPLEEENCLVVLYTNLLVSLKKVWMVGLWIDTRYFVEWRKNEERCSELLHGWRTSYYSSVFHKRITNSYCCMLYFLNETDLKKVSSHASLVKLNRWCGWKGSQGDEVWEWLLFQQATIN